MKEFKPWAKGGLIFDEFKRVSPEHAEEYAEFVLTRPTLGKSKLLQKGLKKINKRRKQAGFKKIKFKDIKLKVPKSWKLITGFPAK